MKRISLPAILGVMVLIVSCKKENRASEKGEIKKGPLQKASDQPLRGNYCFMKAENKDTTYVHLAISGSTVNGEMTWQPWEKDGAEGTLSGKLVSEHEMELLYDYTIEGSKQTETKIMKIDHGKLSVKTGELTDPKDNGNLVYKDASKAVYNEVLDEIPCE